MAKPTKRTELTAAPVEAPAGLDGASTAAQSPPLDAIEITVDSARFESLASEIADSLKEKDLAGDAGAQAPDATSEPAAAFPTRPAIIALQEVRYNRKTYGPSDTLPADIDEGTLYRLAQLGAVTPG